jgi:hypothetical protein
LNNAELAPGKGKKLEVLNFIRRKEVVSPYHLLLPTLSLFIRQVREKP